MIHVARQPILDSMNRVFAYELSYSTGPDTADFSGGDDCAAARLLEGSLLGVGLETLTGGRLGFMTLTRNALLSGAGTLLSSTSVAVQIPEGVEMNSELVSTCRRLHDGGYTIGLVDCIGRESASVLLPYVRFIKVDFACTDRASRAELAAHFSKSRVPLIAANVVSQQDAGEARSLGYRLFQGYHFCKPSITSAVTIPARRLSTLKLLVAINRDDLSTSELESLLKGDAALALRILWSANGAALGLRHEVTSIRHAITVLGRKRIAKWASIWAMADLNDGGSEETLRVAVMRARCCEAIGTLLHGSDGDTYFLLGLFSVLDAILGLPMAVALGHLPVEDTIKEALLGGQNQGRMILEVVIAYCEGQWECAARGMRELSLDEDVLRKAYVESLEFLNSERPSVPDFSTRGAAADTKDTPIGKGRTSRVHT